MPSFKNAKWQAIIFSIVPLRLQTKRNPQIMRVSMKQQLRMTELAGVA
jgi:hypothetical protein